MYCSKCGCLKIQNGDGRWFCKHEHPRSPLPEASVVKKGKIVTMREPLSSEHRFWLILWISITLIVAATALGGIYLMRH